MKNIVFLFLFLVPAFLFAQYPTGTNKSRLGYQTTGDGLIWRGVAADTVIKPRTTANAYFQLDTVNRVLRRYIATQGSWQVVAVTPNLTPYALKTYVDSLYATDYDRDSTNELQTLTFASPLLGISDGNNVDLSPILTGYVTGSGTANYLPKWSAITNLTNSNLFDNNTYVGILNSKPFALGQWTTAGRPTGVQGYIGYNTTLNGIDWYNGTRWATGIESTFARGTATRIPFFDANGQITDVNGFSYANNKLNVGTPQPGPGGGNTFGIVFPNSVSGFGNSITAAYNGNTTDLTFASNTARFTQNSIRLNTTGGASMYLEVNNGNHFIQTPTLFMGGASHATYPSRIGLFTATPSYQVDISSTNAIGLPRGTVAQRPTIVASTTPFRFNTDSTALEYGESVGTWRQLATRAYARSLVAAADGNGIYSGSGSLAGNTVITSGNSNVDWDNVSGFNLISGARAGATSITSDVYSSIKQYVNLAKTKYLQKYNSFDSRALTVSSDPNFTDIFEWNTTGSTLYEWGNATIIDTANTVITYKQGGRYHPSFHDFVGNRVGSGSLHRLKPIFEFRQSLTGNGSAWSPFVTFRTSTDTLFQIKKNGAIDAHQYGVGALEASDLSKTQSNYIAGFATDGTVLDLNVDTLLKKEKYYTITSTSSPQTLSNNFSDNLINQGGTQATFTLTFPASPVDGQVLKITYNNAITTLTLDGNGNTIVGSAVTTGVAGSQRAFKFYTGIGWIKLY